MNFLETIKKATLELVKSKAFETFLWQTANGFIAVLIVSLTDSNWAYAIPIIGILNHTTKYINLEYIKK